MIDATYAVLNLAVYSITKNDAEKAETLLLGSMLPLLRT